MKKITTLLTVFMMLTAITLTAQEAETAKLLSASGKVIKTGPKAQWDKKVYDMGEIQYRVPKEAEFTLTNTGNEPLFITYAKASCGCTNLKYSKDPILPGKSTTMSVTYNASGNGSFRKTITVQTNADESRTVLQIKGKVIRNEEVDQKK